MNDLELCKRIAEIDGVDISMNLSKTYWLDKGKPRHNPDGNWSIGYEEYNPLTNKALLFDLMVKYEVRLDSVTNLDGEVKGYYAYVKGECASSIHGAPERPILECIVEANHE